MEDMRKKEVGISPHVDAASGREGELPNQASKQGLSRRSFISGTTLGALALAAGLTACAKKEDTATDSITPQNIVETIDVDLVILGSGASGLACALQAAQDGMKPLVLEKGSILGGNSNGTEGIFAIGTHFQQAKGIVIKPSDVISEEMHGSQYRPDGSKWLKFIKSSKDNFDWMEKNGVAFSGVADMPGYTLSTAHTYVESGATNYVKPLSAAAKTAGATFRTETRGTKLIMVNGVVKGVYAQNKNGETIQVNAKAIVLATGGVGSNVELLKAQGWTQEKLDSMMVIGMPSVEGDGYKMAMEVGAKDYLPNASLQVFNGIKAIGNDSTVPYTSPLNSAIGLPANPKCVWVNQDGMRCKDESMVFTYNMAATGTALMCNKATYAFFDQTLLNTCVGDKTDQDFLDKALDGTHGDSIFKANTLEELAKHFSLDASTLAETINSYNGYCNVGADPDFGKGAAFLQAFTTPPFYLAKLVPNLVAVDGGVTTNIKSEAVDDEFNTIPGLYAVGLDGAMLWCNVYTQNIGGTMMGNNVHSGRTAARSAKEYISKL